MPNKYCEYCRVEHEMLNFGLNFSGVETLICSDRLNDTLAETGTKPDYGILDAETLVEKGQLSEGSR
jgi:hypothetical protein